MPNMAVLDVVLFRYVAQLFITIIIIVITLKITLACEF